MIVPENIAEIARTAAWKDLLSFVEDKYVANERQKVITAASKGDEYSTVRYQAGRADGSIYILGVLSKLGEKSAKASE